MPKPKGVDAAYWHYSWNPTIGCGGPISSGCKFCYAARLIPPYAEGWQAGEDGPYHGVVDVINGQPVFNGRLGTLRAGHPVWTEPLRWPRVEADLPSLIFITTMGDFLDVNRPQWVLDRACAVIAASQHIGLALTRRSSRSAAYFGGLDPRTVRLWQPKLWLGFSAADQPEFDQHWSVMRALAQRGWFVFVDCAPLIDAIVLPDDALALLKWIIVNGECGGPYVKNERLRPMRTRWALGLHEQAKRADIPFFLRGMGKNRPIPKKLQVREFPKATCTCGS
jgi:protein gp37